MFEKREWVKGDQAPGASDLNRIETGIAENDVVIERIKVLPKLAKNAKPAEVIDAYNALIDAVNGPQSKETKEVDDVLKEETEVEKVTGSPDDQNNEGE